MKAFKQLEQDLKQLSPLGIMELLLGMVHRDPGMMTALCKYLAAYSTTNFERSHPLRQIFTCLYDVQQKHGASTVSELLWGGVPAIAEELEAIYSRRHPYVARTWIDLALFYNYVNADRFDKLVPELRLQQRQVEARFGPNSPDALTLRYAITQSLYAANPHSEATRHAAHEMWNQLTSVGVVFGIRDAKPNSYCYHSPVKVDPWTKRCRRQYDSGVSILKEHVGVRIQPYFAEDYHHCVHVSDAQEAWSAAFDYVGSGKFVSKTTVGLDHTCNGSTSKCLNLTGHACLKRSKPRLSIRGDYSANTVFETTRRQTGGLRQWLPAVSATLGCRFGNFFSIWHISIGVLAAIVAHTFASVRSDFLR